MAGKGFTQGDKSRIQSTADTQGKNTGKGSFPARAQSLADKNFGNAANADTTGHGAATTGHGAATNNVRDQGNDNTGGNKQGTEQTGK